MWGEENCIPWSKGEIVSGNGFDIENGGFRGRIAVNHAEFFGVGRPCNVVDWAILVYSGSVIGLPANSRWNVT